MFGNVRFNGAVRVPFQSISNDTGYRCLFRFDPRLAQTIRELELCRSLIFKIFVLQVAGGVFCQPSKIGVWPSSGL